MAETTPTTLTELARLRKRLARERQIRLEAESIAEKALRDLYDKQQALMTESALRQDLELQIRQAQKMEAIGRLAGGVAHDFNNLLTVIIGCASLVLDDLPADHLVRPQVTEIRTAGDRAAALTRQLLAFGRKQFLAPVVLNLNSIVTDLRRMLSYLVGEEIEVKFQLEPALRPVRADASQLEQVLMNLVVNAKDAMPDGGTLTIETRNVDLDRAYARSHAEVRPGAYAMLAVSDTGIGMDHETKTRLFEPFFTTKEMGRGTGLGLATVYGIVRQSGGHIWVYSEQGRGTTLKVYLPQAVESQLVPHAPPQEAPVRGGVETILVIEDEPAVRGLVCSVLEQHGYSVLAAADGRQALDESERHAGVIHLVIADVILPGQKGPRVADELARARPRIKRLYMSGYTDDALAPGMVETGARFLQKPFSADRLLRLVRDLIDQG